MFKILIIVFSFLLSLGLLSEKYLPFSKELIIGFIALNVLTRSKNQFVIFQKLRETVPLFFIFFIMFLLDGFLYYHLEGEPVMNIKFFIAIIFFFILSVFFSIHPQYIKYSLVYFGIGGGILSVLFSLGYFGQEFYEIRNDRLIFLGENPNSLSVRISLGVLFLIWGAVENVLDVSKIKRLLLLIPIPFMFNLILASGSKGSFLLCLGSVVLYVLLLNNVPRSLKTGIVFLGTVGLVLAFSAFFESSLYERFLTSDLTTGRNEIWIAAFSIFLNNPLGVGEIGYKVEIFNSLDKVIDTHNLFIYLLVAGGIFSFIIFIYFLARLLERTIRNYRYEKNIIAGIIYISMIFVMSKTGGVLTYLVMWYFFACINVSLVSQKPIIVKR